MTGCATGKCLDVFDDNDSPASVISNGSGCMCWSNITLLSSNLVFDKFSEEKISFIAAAPRPSSGNRAKIIINLYYIHTIGILIIFFQPILEHKKVAGVAQDGRLVTQFENC